MKCGSPNSSPDDQPAARLQHSGDLRHGGLVDRESPRARRSARRRPSSRPRTGARSRRPASGMTLVEPALGRAPIHVVEHLLLEVEDLDRPALHPCGHVEASSSRCRPRAPDPRRHRGSQHLAQASPGDRSDAAPRPRSAGEYGQAEGFLRHRDPRRRPPPAAAPSGSGQKPTSRADSSMRIEDDGRQVERDRRVLGLHVVPAAFAGHRPRADRFSSSSDIFTERACADVEPDLHLLRSHRLLIEVSVSRGLNDLGQHAAGRPGVQERDPARTDPRARPSCRSA